MKILAANNHRMKFDLDKYSGQCNKVRFYGAKIHISMNEPALLIFALIIMVQ